MNTQHKVIAILPCVMSQYYRESSPDQEWSRDFAQSNQTSLHKNNQAFLMEKKTPKEKSFF